MIEYIQLIIAFRAIIARIKNKFEWIQAVF